MLRLSNEFPKAKLAEAQERASEELEFARRALAETIARCQQCDAEAWFEFILVASPPSSAHMLGPWCWNPIDGLLFCQGSLYQYEYLNMCVFKSMLNFCLLRKNLFFHKNDLSNFGQTSVSSDIFMPSPFCSCKNAIKGENSRPCG